MKQLTPQVYEWSRYQPGRRLDRNGHFIQGAPGEAGVLIDPVPFQEGDEREVRELGGVAAVLLTGGAAHEGAAGIAATFGCSLQRRGRRWSEHRSPGPSRSTMARRCRRDCAW